MIYFFLFGLTQMIETIGLSLQQPVSRAVTPLGHSCAFGGCSSPHPKGRTPPAYAPVTCQALDVAGAERDRPHGAASLAEKINHVLEQDSGESEGWAGHRGVAAAPSSKARGADHTPAGASSAQRLLCHVQPGPSCT